MDSNKKKVYISGLMGNQLLRCFVAMANSIEDGYEIEAIVASLQPVNYLDKMVEVKVPIRSQTVEGWAVKGWANDINHNLEENVHRLFRYRDRILKEGWIKLKKVEDFISADLCIHLRGGDKKVAPLQWYYNKIRSNFGKYKKVHVCTDDKQWEESMRLWFIEKEEGQSITFTHQDDKRDWFTLLNADKVYCAASSFSLSTLLFNPNKEMIVCSRKSSTYDYRIELGKRCEFPFVKAAMEYCPNLRFED